MKHGCDSIIGLNRYNILKHYIWSLLMNGNKKMMFHIKIANLTFTFDPEIMLWAINMFWFHQTVDIHQCKYKMNQQRIVMKMNLLMHHLKCGLNVIENTQIVLFWWFPWWYIVLMWYIFPTVVSTIIVVITLCVSCNLYL